MKDMLNGAGVSNLEVLRISGLSLSPQTFSAHLNGKHGPTGADIRAAITAVAQRTGVDVEVACAPYPSLRRYAAALSSSPGLTRSSAHARYLEHPEVRDKAGRLLRLLLDGEEEIAATTAPELIFDGNEIELGAALALITEREPTCAAAFLAATIDIHGPFRRDAILRVMGATAAAAVAMVPVVTSTRSPARPGCSAASPAALLSAEREYLTAQRCAVLVGRGEIPRAGAELLALHEDPTYTRQAVLRAVLTRPGDGIIVGAALVRVLFEQHTDTAGKIFEDLLASGGYGPDHHLELLIKELDDPGYQRVAAWLTRDPPWRGQNRRDLLARRFISFSRAEQLARNVAVLARTGHAETVCYFLSRIVDDAGVIEIVRAESPDVTTDLLALATSTIEDAVETPSAPLIRMVITMSLLDSLAHGKALTRQFEQTITHAPILGSKVLRQVLTRHRHDPALPSMLETNRDIIASVLQTLAAAPENTDWLATVDLLLTEAGAAGTELIDRFLTTLGRHSPVDLALWGGNTRNPRIADAVIAALTAIASSDLDLNRYADWMEIIGALKRGSFTREDEDRLRDLRQAASPRHGPKVTGGPIQFAASANRVCAPIPDLNTTEAPPGPEEGGHNNTSEVVDEDPRPTERSEVAFTMPYLGESVTEATVTRWLKHDRDTVEADEAVLEVATDKVDAEIPSPAAGVLTIIAQEDDIVEVGGKLAIIRDPVTTTSPTPSHKEPQRSPVSFRMPAVGESVTEATLIKWLKHDGDTVEAGEAVLEVATDKVDAEIPSPAAGVLTIIAQEDEVYEVGTELAIISSPGAGSPSR
ncbi:biotin/lipoyl-containing protein [Nocardia brasiliensis]|uniref:biotin/lipoyl-containing protein n=1 Tax=Nocardia brasiliensis TaxID=37326 RepID=UPI003D910AC2